MTIRIISRESKLAKLQIDEFKKLLPEQKFSVEFVSSVGDIDLKTSLMSSTVPGDFFTRELDKAILEGRADMAVHSAKDLPFPLPKGLQVIALTKAGDKSDALVSRDGLTLETLPQNAKLGTSSISRKEQILAIRPDLEIVSIRGDIDMRIAYVDRGDCVAVIVATCALHRLGYADKISQILPIETHPLQGNLAVVVKSDRYDLARICTDIDYRRSFGTVALVGAGPGDPELITRKGERYIREADIIFYDDLLDRELLNWATGELVYVGKRQGEHYKKQPEINELLYHAALEGKRVVRLKCGDPLLFSRGGEEIDYLKERFVDVEIVPGVSAYQGCAASLTMPVTKRGISRSLHALSGRYEKPTDLPVSESGTQVIFMGGTRAPLIQEALLNKGWAPEAAVLIITRGTYADEVVEQCVLSELHTKEPVTPALILVGEVANHAVIEPKMLFLGLDPTRAALPGKIVHWPLIELQESEPEQCLDKGGFDGIIFTSRAAAEYFFKHCSLPQEVTVAAVGPHTAESVKALGGHVDIIPEVHDAEHLAHLLDETRVGKWLYPCSNRSKNVLHERDDVETVVFYQTVSKQVQPIELDGFAALFFSSGSTVDSFFELYDAVPESCQILVYGEPTARKLIEHGVERERIMVWPIVK